MVARFVGALCLVLLTISRSRAAAYPIQATYLDFYRNLTPELWALEFQQMQADNIKTVVIVSVGHLQADSTQSVSCSLDPSGAYKDASGFSLAASGLLYPSDLVSAAQRPTVDLLEMVLELADSAGMKVYLGSLQTAGDWSDGTEFCALREYNQRVAAEVVQRYGHHASLQGWYFTQEIWMNWVKYYGQQNGISAAGYYGANLMAQWAADMRAIDDSKVTSAALVIKATGTGAMPGLTAAELELWSASFVQTVNIDLLMPEDGAGSGAGAPPLSELPSYFASMRSAISVAGTHTALWSTVETFTASPTGDVGSEQSLPVNTISRIQTQVTAVAPFVSGYISWMFGDDMSSQATYYPVQADELDRKYRYSFNPLVVPSDDILRLESYWYPGSAPDARYPDSAAAPLLSDGSGGGYSSNALATWVGFADEKHTPAEVQIAADLGSLKAIHSVRALTQSWLGSGILHPVEMWAEVSPDGLSWQRFGSTTNFPSNTQDFSVMWGKVDGAAAARYVRWTFTYTGWMFLAELEVVGIQ